MALCNTPYLLYTKCKLKEDNSVKASNDFRVASTKKPLFIVFATAIVVVVIVLGVVHFIGKRTTANYASEVAKPLEEGLKSVGGIRKCALSASGRVELDGSNTTPWYQVYYELKLPRDRAKEEVIKIAANNGYELRQATLEERGPVPVADAYINDWLYDVANKASSYSELESGKISLFAQVMNVPGTYTCDNGEAAIITAGAETSTIRWDVKLPSFRQ